MPALPVADLHCDLLAYLAASSDHTPFDRVANCSFPQLEEGNVVYQTLAVFCETKPGAAQFAKKQFSHFEKLSQSLPLHMAVAIENASGLCEEDEPLDVAFERLERYCKEYAPPLYISLTWNGENRFGGGNATAIGLKKDGVELLKWLSGKQIAIDLSHTSDQLAFDILEAIDTHGLRITPIASHSNFRAVTDAPRNLPDMIAREIVKRGGLIGLNLVRKFIGPNPAAHIEYAAHLGALDSLCFGADFFHEGTLPQELHHLLPFYHPEYSNSSCYPLLIDSLRPHLTARELEGIAYANFSRFFEERV